MVSIEMLFETGTRTCAHTQHYVNTAMCHLVRQFPEHLMRFTRAKISLIRMHGWSATRALEYNAKDSAAAVCG